MPCYTEIVAGCESLSTHINAMLPSHTCSQQWSMYAKPTCSLRLVELSRIAAGKSEAQAAAGFGLPG